MDAVDQKWIEQGKGLIDRLFPGTTAQLESLGGEYLPLDRGPRRFRGDDGHWKYSLRLVYLIPSRQTRISMKLTFNENGLEVVHFAFHCGPSLDTEGVYFRVDMNRTQGLHFHLRDQGCTEKDHIPAYKATSSLPTTPPDFLRLVKSYLDTGVIPLKVRR